MTPSTNPERHALSSDNDARPRPSRRSQTRSTQNPLACSRMPFNTHHPGDRAAGPHIPEEIMHKRSARANKRAERRHKRRQEIRAAQVIRRQIQTGMTRDEGGYAAFTFAPAELLRRHNRR